ncbi:hypothetical protein HDU98_010095 [Podochytrium sp. JEL0797]|nr:hypothetical protein HDU98_010095 [Podochytrium sp. JEL0797]
MIFSLLVLCILIYLAIRYILWRKAHGGDYNRNYEGFKEEIRSDMRRALASVVEWKDMAKDWVSDRLEAHRNGSNGSGSGAHRGSDSYSALSSHRFLFDEEDSHGTAALGGNVTRFTDDLSDLDDEDLALGSGGGQGQGQVAASGNGTASKAKDTSGARGDSGLLVDL